MNTIFERRIVRALRDEAAFRIAEAVADGKQPGSDYVRDFRRHRQKHEDMLGELAAERQKEAAL